MMDSKNRADSAGITRDYFDALLVEMRHIGAAAPDTSFELYGQTFGTPVMPAALSHLYRVRENGMVELAKAAVSVNTPMWAGMGDTKELEDILATGAKTIKIIKPYADHEKIFSRIEHAEKAGALAVGMDLDHAFSRKGVFDEIEGEEMTSKSYEEFASFVKATHLPFVLKGVLSTRDAELCLKAGARGIVVSHHHGLMDYAVPPLMILPEIAKVIGGAIPIFVDCGIQSGMDTFKALALGATAVSVGRALLFPLKENGHKGAAEEMLSITAGLRHAMGMTASKSLRDIDGSLIHMRRF